MKIYLSSETGWQLFEGTLESLQSEFEKRNIVIHDGAKIGNGATVGDGAKVGNEAKVGYGATIGDGAKVGNEATIGDGAKIVFCLYIQGTKHAVNYWGQGKDGIKKIAIGCHVHPFDFWLENFEKIGQENEYTPDQIAEYKAYIDLVISVHGKNDW